MLSAGFPALLFSACWLLAAAGVSLASAPGASQTGAPAPWLLLAAGGAIVALASLLTALCLRAKRLENELRSSRRHYEYLANNSADMIWILAADLRPTYVSPAVSSFLGYSPQEFLGGGLSEICGPDFCGRLQDLFAALTRDPPTTAGVATRFEMEFVCKDKTPVWGETLVSLIRDAESGVMNFICATRDIHSRKQAELVIKAQGKRFLQLIEEQVDALLVLGTDRKIRFANRVALELFQARAEEFLGSDFDRPVSVDSVTEIRVPGPEPDSSQVLEMRANPIHWEDEPAFLVSLRNITARTLMEEALQRSEERYRTVADYTYGCETWIGPDGNFLYISPSCKELTGYPPEAFAQGVDSFERVVHPEDQPLWRQHFEKAKQVDGETLDFRLFLKEGRQRWISIVSRAVSNQEGGSLGLRCSMRDITERKLMELQLRRHALYDTLTGLGNRTICLDRILHGLERAKRRDDYFYAVIFMGLDRFKGVNESMGHAFGDKVLVEVSRRLTGCVRDLDTLSRFGGDEFVIFLEELNTPREATQIIKRICAALRAPYAIDGFEVQLTASLGVVLSPADYANPEDLLRNATIAMYRAKEAGRDRFKIFNSKMLERAVRVMNLENELRRAIVNNEFFLMFQPVLRLTSETLMGFEALIRWRHPERGVVAPGEFIPLAEETGLIVEIGRFVLEEACATLASWRAESPGAADLVMSVNISGKQFSQTGLVELVRRTLDTTDLPAGNLKLEITETAIMDNAQLAIERLIRLKNLGLTLSIDDFSTGYSSMSYLQKFPLDNLKIDLSFVRMMEIAPENVEIVKAIIDLAHNLGLEVVAEGVENLLQKQLLSKLGCEYGQGYLFARPVDKAQAAVLIRNATRTNSAPSLARSA
jgi:diguanylate cyclase (GGDEF)-like protein/PAS domain S-box-containing protein